jgi:tetratricopeptide (TPR) repeat protein
MDRIITKTLAEIYFQQGHFQEAYEIYKALSEKDPSDLEIQKRLDELSKRSGLSPSSIQKPPRSTEEKIHFLERWLANVQERKRR